MESHEPRAALGTGTIQLHKSDPLEVIAILLPIFVIFVVIGWLTRPQSNGFPAVPENMLVTVKAANVVNGVGEVLHRTAGNGAVLDITVDPPWSAGSWTVGIDNLDGARLCTPSTLPDLVTPGLALLGPTHVVPQRLTFLGTSLGAPSYEVKSRGPMSVWLCWSSGGPVNLNGPYLERAVSGGRCKQSQPIRRGADHA